MGALALFEQSTLSQKRQVSSIEVRLCGWLELALVLACIAVGKTVAQFLQINMGRRMVHHHALEFPDGKTVLLAAVRRPARNRVLRETPLLGLLAEQMKMRGYG